MHTSRWAWKNGADTRCKGNPLKTRKLALSSAINQKHATKRHGSLQYAQNTAKRHITSLRATRGNSTPQYATTRQGTSCHAMTRLKTSHHATEFHYTTQEATAHYNTPRYIMSRYNTPKKPRITPRSFTKRRTRPQLTIKRHEPSCHVRSQLCRNTLHFFFSPSYRLISLAPFRFQPTYPLP